MGGATASPLQAVGAPRNQAGNSITTTGQITNPNATGGQQSNNHGNAGAFDFIASNPWGSAGINSAMNSSGGSGYNNPVGSLNWGSSGNSGNGGVPSGGQVYSAGTYGIPGAFLDKLFTYFTQNQNQGQQQQPQQQQSASASATQDSGAPVVQQTQKQPVQSQNPNPYAPPVSSGPATMVGNGIYGGPANPFTGDGNTWYQYTSGGNQEVAAPDTATQQKIAQQWIDAGNAHAGLTLDPTIKTLMGSHPDWFAGDAVSRNYMNNLGIAYTDPTKTPVVVDNPSNSGGSSAGGGSQTVIGPGDGSSTSSGEPAVQPVVQPPKGPTYAASDPLGAQYWMDVYGYSPEQAASMAAQAANSPGFGGINTQATGDRRGGLIDLVARRKRR